MAQHIFLTIHPEFSGTVLRTILKSMPILSHSFSDFFSYFPDNFWNGDFLGTCW